MDARHGVTLGYTPGGKRVFAHTIPNRSVHIIVMEGGGIMPGAFTGVFAGLAQCQRAFDEWLEAKENPAPTTKRRTKKELSSDSAV